ncbi:ribosome silencing factor [Oecophyllibacter saccharovorans]|uniref:ribosome silencing factor n=1 Tax=Oecophyllibacter saccharovorans TaxID=2558360 RepID=UPI001144D7BD|nr:ribosome silencing factor [Oecophyllibacter saccharovorans]
MKNGIEITGTPAGMTREEALTGLLKIIVESLEEDKAEDVVIMDLSGRASFTERMVIATGLSERQMSAMAQHLERKLKEAGYGYGETEGAQGSDWVLMDAGDVVVNLFMPESRELYALERMWGHEFDQADEEVAIGSAHTKGRRRSS